MSHIKIAKIYILMTVELVTCLEKNFKIKIVCVTAFLAVCDSIFLSTILHACVDTTALERFLENNLAFAQQYSDTSRN